MPSKNPSRLYRSPQIKGHKQLSPFLCWSPPISADSSQPLTVEIFNFFSTVQLPGPLLTDHQLCVLICWALDAWSSGDRSFSCSLHTIGAGPFYSRHHSHLVKAALYFSHSFCLVIQPTASPLSPPPSFLWFIDCEFSPWSIIFHLTFYHQVVGHLKDQKESIQHPGCMLLELLVSRDGHAAISTTLSKEVS